MSAPMSPDVAPDFLPQTPDLICPDCGGPGVTWEDDFVMCDDCVRLMIARRALNDGCQEGRTDG